MKRPYFAQVCAAALLVLAVVAQASADCGNSVLNGVYGFSITGFVGNTNRTSNTASTVPNAVLGSFKFDGAGNVVDEHLVSQSDTTFPILQSGTYSLSADPNTGVCGGAATFSASGTVWYLRIVDGANQIKFIVTGGGRVIGGTMVKDGTE